MENCYLVRTEDNRLLCFFYLRDYGIVFRAYENNKFTKVETVIENVRNNFTVFIFKNTIYLFCQDYDFNIIVCKGNAINFSNKIIMQNSTKEKKELQVTALFSGEDLSLIYNLSNNEASKLILHSLTSNNSIKIIDTFNNISNKEYYSLQKIADNHLILFYKASLKPYILGHKEISYNIAGKYNVFYNSDKPIIDTSFLTTTNEIHVLYISKNLFSSQLVYKKKVNSKYSEAKILCEGEKLNNCLIFYINNILYAFCVSNFSIYYCSSKNDGKSFSLPILYKSNYENLMKINYISAISQNKETYYLREVYTEKDNPCNIKILTELYPDFFITNSNIEENLIKTKEEYFDIILKEDKERYLPDETLNFEKISSIKDKNFYIKENSILKQEIENLKNQIKNN